MRPFMHSLMPQEDFLLFQEIEGVVQQMPDVDLGADKDGRILVSCHMVARALARLFPEVEWRDGFFQRRGQRHSWLLVKRNPDLIIDPYPIALLGGPIMVHVGYFTPWRKMYIEAKLSNLGGNTFRKHVILVTQTMRGVESLS